MRIPSTTPDVEQWLVAFRDDVFNIKPNTAPPYAHDIVRADMQNHATPISRYCRVGIQSWVVVATGRSDIGAAFDRGASFAAALTGAARTGFLLDAEVDSGPTRVTDPTSGLEYAYTTLLLEVAVV